MRQFDINATTGDTTEDIPSALNLARKGDMISIRCLIPRFDGAILSQAWKEALWDKFVTGAPLRNAFSEQMMSLECGGATLEQRREAFAASSLKMAALDGDVHRGKLEAGQSAGLVQELRPASDVVARIAREYADALAELPVPQVWLCSTQFSF